MSTPTTIIAASADIAVPVARSAMMVDASVRGACSPVGTGHARGAASLRDAPLDTSLAPADAPNPPLSVPWAVLAHVV
jgi:hypothetical protein